MALNLKTLALAQGRGSPPTNVRVDENLNRNKPEQKEGPRVCLNSNLRSRRRANYYTNRKVLSLPVIKFPNLEVQVNKHWEEDLRIVIAQLQLKGYIFFGKTCKRTKKEIKLENFEILKQKKSLGEDKKQSKPAGDEGKEAVKNPPWLKPGSEAKVERLKRKRMEGKSGNSSGQGKFSKNDDHQSVAVNVRERKFPDDKRRVCSSAECKTFLGEANRNRKSKDLPSIDKPGALNPETNEKYLQDSYNNAFQRHVDNLTNVISQHRNSTGAEKPKTEVHIHPTENSKNLRNVTPLSKVEIKNETGPDQEITFANEEEDEEEFEDFSNMGRMKNFKKIEEFTEEEGLFEELLEPNPMITFNHVCSEAESDQVHFNQIKLGSRSPSPMLEVPNSKTASQKMASRPPL